ncbi:MAG: hypothetical protein B7Z54_02080 [Sphingobacteriales bacterium 12-47-4]|nr:MAG: hypothetical protein B7Z54_02080 [Sphingobacteriales bacterium 12-47-4]
MHDGRVLVATNVLTDPQSDIAVLRIHSDSPLPSARLGNSDMVSVGDWVVALGQPFGLESTVTAGIISAKNRGIGITARENFLQTDAAINPGNSGGPLVNLKGDVIGINTAISSRDGGNNGIGFAVPSNLAQWISDQLVTTGKVHRSYLGVGIQPVSYELASQLGVPPRGGVAVTSVLPNSPAAKTGLKVGDVIVKFGAASLMNPQQLQIEVEKTAVGHPVDVAVIREGKPIVLKYDPAEAPSDFGVPSTNERNATPEGVKEQSLGVELMPMSNAIGKQLGMEGQVGLVVTAVQDGSAASKAGLEPGMVITQVNRQEVNTVADFEQAVKNDKDGSVLLLVKTEQGSQFVVVTK